MTPLRQKKIVSDAIAPTERDRYRPGIPSGQIVSTVTRAWDEASREHGSMLASMKERTERW